MTIDRRTFIGTMGAAYLALGRLRAATIPQVGVQLYTVRTLMEKDFEGTLASIAGIGYKEVEFAGYFKRTPDQVKEILARTKLTSPSAHIDYASLTGDAWLKAIDTAKTIGHEYLINAWVDESIRNQPGSWPKIADTYNRAGEISKKAGIQFAYHNHNFEYSPVDGKLPYDILLDSCNPDTVKMEMDLCWISAAGKDPLDYFRRYPGRFPLVHVKGLATIPTPVGDGPVPIDKVLPDITEVGHRDLINWKRIFAQSQQAGIKHYFVEHDVPKVPLDSLKASYEYVSQLQF
jgi:sugar phosphate isomerase/epimerase